MQGEGVLVLSPPRPTPLSAPDDRDDHPDGRAPATAAALALLAFGANMASPLLPGYQQRLGFDDLTLTLLYATYAVSSVPALLLLGPLGDRVGRVRMVRWGLLLAAAGSACFAIGHDVAWLFAGRVLQGVALGAATGAGMALLAAAGRGRAVGVGALAFLAGTAAGPGLTGLLAAALPAPYVSVNVVHAVAVLIAYRSLSGAPRPDGGAAATATRRPALPRRDPGAFLAAMATGFVSWAVVGLFLGLVPSVVARASGTAGPAVLGAVAALVVLAALPGPLLLTRLPAARAQRDGLVLLACGAGVLATTGGAAPLPVVLATALVAGFGHGLAYGGAHRVVESLAAGDDAAGITATAYVVQYVGAGVPAVLVGLLALRMPLDGATALLSALVLGAAGCALAVHAARSRDALPAVQDVVQALRATAVGIHQANGIMRIRTPA